MLIGEFCALLLILLAFTIAHSLSKRTDKFENGVKYKQ